jgi:hypothetical protein
MVVQALCQHTAYSPREQDPYAFPYAFPLTLVEDVTPTGNQAAPTFFAHFFEPHPAITLETEAMSLAV